MNNLDCLIIVIGGNGRIGKNFCLEALNNTNHNVINIDPSPDDFIKKKIQDKKRYLHIPIPIGKSNDAKKIINLIDEKFPEKKINSLVNLSRVRINDIDELLINENDIIKNINVQLSGLNQLIDLFVNEKNFRDFSIIHAGSLSSRLVNHQSVLYHYLKGAIESASKALAFKLGKYNIRSNVLICGLVKDPLFKLSSKQRKVEKASIPLFSGPPTISDVANLILFLISSKSRAITGTSIVIDAGMSLPDNYTILSNLKSFN